MPLPKLPTSSSNKSKKKLKEKVRKQEELDWNENEKMVESRKKIDAASEKARLKAEYRKIMNKQSTSTAAATRETYQVRREEIKKIGTYSSSSNISNGRDAKNRVLIARDNFAARKFSFGEQGGVYKAKTNAEVRRHKAAAHDIDVTYFLCGVEDCEYKAKEAGNLKKHKAMAHDVDVTYFLCGVDGCDYKAKQASTLKQHKADVHDVDFTFHL